MSFVAETILNVDDYDPGRYARTKTLRQAGFPVIEATSGRQSLDLVLEHRPPLVLLDVNLPDISGFEVCTRIKKDPRTASTTVLHISASNVESQHMVRGYDAGADSYLVEPVDPPVLIATVRAFLRARKAEEALRKSNEELERFAYMVAHDLNEPLRTVTAHTELLARQLGSQLDESTRERLRFVVEGAKRMRFLIDDILKYSHANVVDDVQKIDCEVVLSEVTANLDAAIRDSGARVTHDSLPVIMAHAKIEQVFQNLISNAIKYRRDGVPPCVHVSAVADRDTWMFSVRDNGMGIDDQYKRGIFEIFRRHNNGGAVPGNGIGLALCQKIVEAHGGKIWVESGLGAGSVFYFTIPQRS